MCESLFQTESYFGSKSSLEIKRELIESSIPLTTNTLEYQNCFYPSPLLTTSTTTIPSEDKNQFPLNSPFRTPPSNLRKSPQNLRTPSPIPQMPSPIPQILSTLQAPPVVLFNYKLGLASKPSQTPAHTKICKQKADARSQKYEPNRRLRKNPKVVSEILQKKHDKAKKRKQRNKDIV
ncbi:hypothetical protein TWF102_006951 [Orbilia oligospora]|uniref:Uncharacterized protein n=1 Tax=Orbilia oligospora TaxID=2813651 RepID=A0A7C8NAE1_ORBOL|nr:hypothetical protein TWF102_006951 [Orbilia oligospora]